MTHIYNNCNFFWGGCSLFSMLHHCRPTRLWWWLQWAYYMWSQIQCPWIIMAQHNDNKRLLSISNMRRTWVMTREVFSSNRLSFFLFNISFIYPRRSRFRTTPCRTLIQSFGSQSLYFDSKDYCCRLAVWLIFSVVDICCVAASEKGIIEPVPRASQRKVAIWSPSGLTYIYR